MKLFSWAHWIHAYKAFVKGPPECPLRERVAARITELQEQILNHQLEQVKLQADQQCWIEQSAILRSWLSDQKGVQTTLVDVK